MCVREHCLDADSGIQLIDFKMFKLIFKHAKYSNTNIIAIEVNCLKAKTNKYFQLSIIFSELCYISYSAPVHFGWYGNRISLVFFCNYYWSIYFVHFRNVNFHANHSVLFIFCWKWWFGFAHWCHMPNAHRMIWNHLLFVPNENVLKIHLEARSLMQLPIQLVE